MLCDLCIIQLNVAYQYKTLAVEQDAKHKQYLIENGVNSSPNSDNSTLNSVEQRTPTVARPLTFPANISSSHHHRLIKSEATDYEAMSDITIETNTDLVEDLSRNGVNSSASNQRFGTSNMVCVRDLDLLRTNGDSDIEFINNCLPSSFRHFENPANTVGSHQSTTTTTTATIASKQLVIAASESTNQDTIVTTDEKYKSVESIDTEKSKVTAAQVNPLPRKKRKSVKFVDSDLKKGLRPKSSDGIDYSLVRRRKRKLINPVHRLRRKIKEEDEATKQLPSKNSKNVTVNNDRALIPKNSSILRTKRKRNFIDGKDNVQFRRGQHTTKHKTKYRENIDAKKLTIKETDRFRFADIKTIDSRISTKN